MTCYIRGLSKAEYSMLREMCRYANNLYNKALYEVRQHYFKTGQYLRYEKNYHICKNNENFRTLAVSVGVQTLRKVAHAFTTFFTLIHKAKAGDYNFKNIRLPQYRKKSGMYPLFLQIGNKAAYISKSGWLTIPQCRTFYEAHSKHKIKIKLPPKLRDMKIEQVTILPVLDGRAFQIEYCYQCEPEDLKLNPDNCLSIDIGVNNLCACVDSNGASFLMDGRRIKSINHCWNKKCAQIKSIYSHQNIYTGSKIQSLTLKRNEQIRDIIRKTARYIINYCIAHDIGTLVVGCNPLWKDNINLGSVNNQNFTYIPFAYLRLMLRSHCERCGMTYLEQEESYTSKASFLDGDDIPVYDGQTKHTFSGVRIKRGLYRSRSGRLINADINGAANIMRKSKQNLNFEKLCTGLTVSPTRIRVV